VTVKELISHLSEMPSESLVVMRANDNDYMPVIAVEEDDNCGGECPLVWVIALTHGEQP
jgi:hypothetical protein